MTHTQSNLSPAESLSALVDGATDLHVLASGLDDRLRADWNAYHAVGEVLRAPGRVASKEIYGADPAFVQRVMQRLESEKIQPSVAVLTTDNAAMQRRQAANDSTFRWKLVAGFASFSAMAVFVWTLVGSPSAAPEQLAKSATGTELVMASPQGLIVRDARLEELLSAHKQLGGTSLPAPSGFLRNAGFEAPNNGQR